MEGSILCTRLACRARSNWRSGSNFEQKPPACHSDRALCSRQLDMVRRFQLSEQEKQYREQVMR
jgi:hypothetical protein